MRGGTLISPNQHFKENMFAGYQNSARHDFRESLLMGLPFPVFFVQGSKAEKATGSRMCVQPT